MNNLVKTGRIFYGVSMACVGFHQLFYGQFTAMIVPAWPVQNVLYTLLAYMGNGALMVVGVAIATNKNARNICLVLGGIFLLLFLFSHVPYEIIFDPYSYHLALWTNALKEFAFAGGAFVIAGTLAAGRQKKSVLINILEKLIPYGHWMFATTMTLFGVMHLKYIEHVHKLVPLWIPYPVFWTGATGVLLIGAGVSIFFRIKLKITANLLALMVLIWFIILHIPRSIANPFGDGGNEIASAFSALVFTGIALVIANHESQN